MTLVCETALEKARSCMTGLRLDEAAHVAGCSFASFRWARRNIFSSASRSPVK